MNDALQVDGVDISHYQDGDIDWAKAKAAGVKFVYHKVSEGAHITDGLYDQRRREARRADIPFGGYHFARPSSAEGDDVEREAWNFIHTGDPQPGDLLPMLDLEDTGGLNKDQLTTWVWRFCEAVMNRVGVKPIIYTPFDLNRHFKTRLWVARYNDDNVDPKVPEPWDMWDIWQFSNGEYGRPNQVDGLGHVDLNTLRRGVRVKNLLIPTPKEDENFTVLSTAHCSMQFNDGRKQKYRDVQRLFARDYDILTGTEAGGQPLAGFLRDEAENSGYRFHRSRSCWVAVKRSIVDGGWRDGYDPVLESSDGTGMHGDRGIAWVSFANSDLGRITIGAGHYLTNGRRQGDPNYPWNVRYAKAIGNWAHQHGKGTDLVMYHGDQNMVDRNTDTFLGQPLTSAWDLLERWENTGHGNIDVIAKYDRDGRVKFDKIKALDDKEFPLHTDHYLVEAKVNIRHMRSDCDDM